MVMGVLYADNSLSGTLSGLCESFVQTTRYSEHCPDYVRLLYRRFIIRNIVRFVCKGPSGGFVRISEQKVFSRLRKYPKGNR